MKKYNYNFLDIYKRNKDVFIKPKFRWYFGTWRKEPNLPVWRRGPIIRFGKNNYKYLGNDSISRLEAEKWDGKEYEETWNYAKLVDSKWTEGGKKNHPILSKFLKPSYELPIWLAFHWYNNDIMYKTKWTEDDFRYEFPAHITFVFFGLAISVTAYIPKENEDDWLCNDQYWESMLTYSYYNGDLEKTNDSCGWYNRPGQKGFRFKFDPKFLRNQEDRDKLISIQENLIPEIIKKYEEEEKEIKETKCYAIYADIRNAQPNEDGRSYKFDGWYKVLHKRKLLAYKTEEDCQRVLNNINKIVEHTKNNELKHIEYKMFIGNKNEYIKWNSFSLFLDDIIDKDMNMFEGIYKLI